MNTLILCVALIGQMPSNPGVPWNNEKERLQWVENMRIQEAFAKAQARKARIANNYGGSINRHFTAVSGLPYYSYGTRINPYYNNSSSYNSNYYYRCR